jgi:hypothetical protein
MTIKSDLKGNNNEMGSIRAWFKYSHCKQLAFMSLGAFWDFRNDKSNPEYEQYVDKVIQSFVDNLDNLVIDTHYLYCESMEGKFWIENKYYGWRLEHPHTPSMVLTIKQIAKVDNMLRAVEARNCSNLL